MTTKFSEEEKREWIWQVLAETQKGHHFRVIDFHNMQCVNCDEIYANDPNIVYEKCPKYWDDRGKLREVPEDF